MQTGRKTKLDTKAFAVMGMLSAIAFVAKLISNVFPMVSGFLSFDLKDVIIVIAGFMMGPVASVLISIGTPCGSARHDRSNDSLELADYAALYGRSERSC